jgi:hypothetical protein
MTFDERVINALGSLMLENLRLQTLLDMTVPKQTSAEPEKIDVPV